MRALGILVLLSGLLLNPVALSMLLPDVALLAYPSTRIAVLLTNAALVAVGLWLVLRGPNRASGTRSNRAVFAFLLLATLAGAWGSALFVFSALRTRSLPNVVLVVLDTTRRDRLSLYGYERPTTPNLDRLASESTVWDDAYATSTWTSPSHATLFTGLFPADHGVTQAAWEMPSELHTLSEGLRAEGHRTVGIVGNPMVGKAFGFDQGFDAYFETWREQLWHDGVHPALAHLEEVLDAEDDRPFFVFVNLIEPHSPYTSGVEHRAGFVRHPEMDLSENDWRSFYTGDTHFTSDELEHLGDVYDAGLRYVDGLVAELVSSLRKHGKLDDTVFVVTADHGENLGEHGMVDHVFSLYEPTVQIPLLIRHPESFAAGRRVGAPVHLGDVYVTLANLTGIEPGAAVGLDLRSGEIPDDRPILLSYDYPRQALSVMGEDANHPALTRYKRRLWALRAGSLKLIVGDDGRAELYDLEADPRELIDLAGSDTERVQALLERLSRFVDLGAAAREATGSPAVLDAETADELRRLGYLGDAEEGKQ